MDDELLAACRAGQVQDFLTRNTKSASEALEEIWYYKCNPEVFSCLLENGAALGLPPRTFAKMVRRSPEALQLLSKHGFDIKSHGYLVLQDYAGDPETLDWLLDQGVDVNRTDERRLDTGFALAICDSDWSVHLLNNVAANGNVQLFDHLVARGADPSRSLALHSASRCDDPTKSVAMVSHLLDTHKMDIHSDTDDFQSLFNDPPGSGTPLALAIHNRNVHVVKELLRRRALDDESESKIGMLSAAVGGFRAQGFTPAIEPLLEAGADASLGLQFAARDGNVGAAQVCLQYGGDAASAVVDAGERVLETGDRLRRCTEDGDENPGYEIEQHEDAKHVLRLLKMWNVANGMGRTSL